MKLVERNFLCFNIVVIIFYFSTARSCSPSKLLLGMYNCTRILSETYKQDVSGRQTPLRTTSNKTKYLFIYSWKNLFYPSQLHLLNTFYVTAQNIFTTYIQNLVETCKICSSKTSIYFKPNKKVDLQLQ